MDALTIDELLSRRAWLKRAETELFERLEQRFVAHGGVRHVNDPLYQRMWYARKRVRSELSRVDAAIELRINQAA